MTNSDKISELADRYKASKPGAVRSESLFAQWNAEVEDLQRRGAFANAEELYGPLPSPEVVIAALQEIDPLEGDDTLAAYHLPRRPVVVTLSIPLTLDAFLDLPEEKPALEFIDGEVCQKVSPKTRHSVIQGAIWNRVNTLCRGSRAARALTEERCTFAGRSVVPDVAVFLTSRLPVDERGRLTDQDPGAPDVAFEVISPSQPVNRLIARCSWYVQNGVGAALLFDPDDESVSVFEPNQVPRTMSGDAPIDLTHVVASLQFTPAEIFADLVL